MKPARSICGTSSRPNGHADYQGQQDESAEQPESKTWIASLSSLRHSHCSFSRNGLDGDSGRWHP